MSNRIVITKAGESIQKLDRYTKKGIAQNVLYKGESRSVEITGPANTHFSLPARIPIYITCETTGERIRKWITGFVTFSNFHNKLEFYENKKED